MCGFCQFFWLSRFVWVEGSFVLVMWGLAAWEWTEHLWVAWGIVWMKMRSLQDGICLVVDQETVDVTGRKWFAAEGRSVSRFFGWEKWWAKKFM